MSERATLMRHGMATLFAAAVLLDAHAPIGAQGGRDSTTLQRYFAARARVEITRAALKGFDTLSVTPRPAVELRHGNLTLQFDMGAITTDDSAALAHSLRDAADHIARYYGSGASLWVGSLTFVARGGTSAQTHERRISLRSQSSISDADSWAARTSEVRPGATDFMTATAARIANGRRAEKMLNWWQFSGRPLSISEWEEAATSLATSPSAVAHRCLSRSPDFCSAILGLDQSTYVPVSQYAPEDYPMLIEMAGERWKPDTPRRRIARRCIEERDGASCNTAIGWYGIPDAVPGRVRQTFVDLALEMGGPHAFARLDSAHGTVREQIATVAGVPADSVLVAWQRGVKRSFPVRPIAGATFTTLGWLAAIFLLVRRRPRCA